MSYRIRIAYLMLLSFITAITVNSATLEGQFSNELGTIDYDCVLKLIPATNVPDKSAVRVKLEWASEKAYSSITLTKKRISISAVINGKLKSYASSASAVIPGKPYQLTLVRRKSNIGIEINGFLLSKVAIPRSTGTQAGIRADSGWKVEEARIQRLEPVIFADDFMRDFQGKSPWPKTSGQWDQRSAWDQLSFSTNMLSNLIRISLDPAKNEGQNSFACIGRSQNGKPAICTTGNAFWEDYTYSVAVNSAEHGACGIILNLNGVGDGLLVRWTPANSPGTDGNQLVLYKYRLADGKMAKIASSAGGYVPDQWYKITAISKLGSVKVLIDGIERISVNSIYPWRGSIGLYAEGNNWTTFDDVTAYGSNVDMDLIFEAIQEKIAQKFINDKNGMKEWALDLGDWLIDKNTPTFHWYRQDLFGDHNWITMKVIKAVFSTTNSGKPASELMIMLNGDGVNANSGYRAVLQLEDPLARQMNCTLYRDSSVLAKNTLPVPEGDEYLLRFWRSGYRIWLEVDGEKVIEAKDASPLPGLRSSYNNVGAAFENLKDIQVLGENTLDYPFTGAPVDWFSIGTWEPSMRWSCTPQWSFLAGWSRGAAVLWQKQRFSGDHSIEAYVGTKMDYPRETENYYNRQGYFAVTMCGDGRDPKNGYAGVYGFPDDNGKPLARAVILRNGVVVAQTKIGRRDWSSNHRLWFLLQISKIGNQINFTARIGNETYELKFSDDDPITEGIPAIWTFNNAMTVARARIDYSIKPTPRNEPQVIIANPWYPEWADKGKTMKLDLSRSWSTTGNKVSWKVTPAEVPAGDEDAVSVSEGKAVYTPKQTGKHWYKIAATDKTFQSQDFHLSMPVLDPSLGRDDSHALVLYRFDEGQGTVIHDRSSVAPALDLNIEANSVEWLPGQGVKLSGTSKAMSSSLPADKLMAIKTNKACSFECWESSESFYSPNGRSQIFFSWEPVAAGNTRPIPNFAFGNSEDKLLIATGAKDYKMDQLLSCPGFLTMFRHVMITWDGATTSFYVDGVKKADRQSPWTPDNWVAGSPLYVGDQQPIGKNRNNVRPLMGSLYLVAIHDRCFTPEEVMKNFNAGPSAR